MKKKFILDESVDNIRRVIENDKDGIDIVGAVSLTMADAYSDCIEADARREEIETELEEKAEEVILDTPDTGHKVVNAYTLEESLTEVAQPEDTASGETEEEVFEETEETRTRAKNEFTHEDYLDFDMFDFIMSLASTQSWPPVKNVLGKKKIHKFNYTGSDDYVHDEGPNDHSQIGVSFDGSTIDIYHRATEFKEKKPNGTLETVKPFEDVLKMCDIFGIQYRGPFTLRSPSAVWPVYYSITVPQIDGVPELVDDFFAKQGKKMEDVIGDANWVKQYYKHQAMEEEATSRELNDMQVEAIFAKAIRVAAQSSDSLQQHWKNLRQELESKGLKFGATKLRTRFFDAFDDSFED